jgi:GNAT superfamily N-acetyltransferase
MHVPISIEEVNVTLTPGIAGIPCTFRVEAILEATQTEAGAWTLTEGRAAVPYIKDYDAITGNRPGHWADQFDLSNWGLLMARQGEQDVGATLIAFDTPGVEMLEGRRDLAVLWDLRVVPDCRGQGIGARLIAAAESWARGRGCTEIRVETQTINVAACERYTKSGFRLIRVNADAYPDHPDETQLIWSKALEQGET